MPRNRDNTTASAFVSNAWVANSGLSTTKLDSEHEFEVTVANDQKVTVSQWIPNACMKFGPYTERIDLFVFSASDAFDIVLGRQWYKLRNVMLDNSDDSLILRKLPLEDKVSFAAGQNRVRKKNRQLLDNAQLVKVPLTKGSTTVFRKSRYIGMQCFDLVPDSDESEVYFTQAAFDRANKRSLEQRTDPQPMYCLKITKNILGHEVEIQKPDEEVLAEFDIPDEDYVVPSTVNKYNARVPKTKNVLHEFESIENTLLLWRRGLLLMNLCRSAGINLVLILNTLKVTRFLLR
jgi:hypothetical protein